MKSNIATALALVISCLAAPVTAEPVNVNTANAEVRGGMLAQAEQAFGTRFHVAP